MSCQEVQRFVLSVSSVVLVLLLSGCNVDAIWVSRTVWFQRDNNPQYFDLANENASMGTINVTLSPNKNWISGPHLGALQTSDASGLIKSRVEVRIDRSKSRRKERLAVPSR